MTIDDLQARYVKALNAKDMQGWLACFGADGRYVCTSRENHDAGLPLAIMMDDCPERLRDRVKFITEVWAGTFEDYRMRHVVQRISAREVTSTGFEVESNFIVTHTNAKGHSDILAAGVYLDTVSISAGKAQFRSKTAIIDDHATCRYLVYPI